MTLQQTIYNVHVYRETRLFFPDITAASAEGAASIATDRGTGDAHTIDDCEGETIAALVDVKGDPEFRQSRLIDFRAGRRQALLDALNSLNAALNHHAHWLPTMSAHLSDVVSKAIKIAKTL